MHYGKTEILMFNVKGEKWLGKNSLRREDNVQLGLREMLCDGGMAKGRLLWIRYRIFISMKLRYFLLFDNR